MYGSQLLRTFLGEPTKCCKINNLSTIWRLSKREGLRVTLERKRKDLEFWTRTASQSLMERSLVKTVLYFPGREDFYIFPLGNKGKSFIMERKSERNVHHLSPQRYLQKHIHTDTHTHTHPSFSSSFHFHSSSFGDRKIKDLKIISHRGQLGSLSSLTWSLTSGKGFWQFTLVEWKSNMIGKA